MITLNPKITANEHDQNSKRETKRLTFEDRLQLVKQPFPENFQASKANLNLPRPTGEETKDEALEIMRETVANTIENAQTDFRDKMLDVYYEIKEYVDCKGAPILDKCNFGDFMLFCDSYSGVPRKHELMTECYGHKFSEGLNEDLDTMDPY